MRSTGNIRLRSNNSSKKRWITALVKSRSWLNLKKVILKSYKLTTLPIRVRPAFIILTALALILLALLGFHPSLASSITPQGVPSWDKLLHFVGFTLATMAFFAVFEVEGRRGFWSRWGVEIATAIVCGVVGSIGSEFVQGLLPYKTFQWGDVIANLLGTTLGLFTSHELAKAHRRSLEIERLYPSIPAPSSSSAYPPTWNDRNPTGDNTASQFELESDEEDEEEEEEEERDDAGRGLLERNGNTSTGKERRRREENVWGDDEEEIFQVQR